MINWETTILIPIITVILGGFYFWIKSQIENRQKKKESIQQNKEIVVGQVLTLWGQKLSRKAGNSWLDELREANRNFITWASDEILIEYVQFLKGKDKEWDKNIEDYELNLGKAILQFRKELGYKNKKEILKPIDIVLIYKTGWRIPL